MCCVWPAAAICAAAEKEEETWKKWNGGGARRKGGGKSDMKRGRKKRQTGSTWVWWFVFSNTSFFLFPSAHIYTVLKHRLHLFFFSPPFSVSLCVQPSGYRSICVTTSSYTKLTLCVLKWMCVFVRGGVIQFTGRLCIFVHPFGRLVFVYLFCCS